MFFLFLQEIVLFMQHFDPKSESERSCHGQQIFVKQENFFDHALRSIYDLLTLKNAFEKPYAFR